MNITKEQFERISPYFPRQRGNVKIDNFTFISDILYMAENGCEWRASPAEFGNWNSLCGRFERWAENGVTRRVFAAPRAEEIIAVRVEILALDSPSRKARPDAHGALKKEGSSPLGSRKEAGTPSFMWCPRMIRSSLKRASLKGNATTAPKGES
ncbi:MAG: transposase [Synergistaceae bacterium]|jgi:transposase|nr:transposase [Synergistaceae bacterium]